MRAAFITQFVESLGNFKIGSIPVPYLRPGHALVQVHAASINPVDYKAVFGTVAARGWRIPFPYVPGEDYAGIVVAVAEDVDSVVVGDAVFACNWGQGRIDDTESEDAVVSGAFAEYALVRASKLSKKPQTLSFAEAATIGIAGTTAFECVFKIGKAAPGTRLLVLGGSSAVGINAIQFAKIAGAHVIATASDRTTEFVSKQLAPDHLISYQSAKWEEQLRDIDVIVDCVGEREAVQRALANNVIKPGGVFVSIASSAMSADPAAFPSLSYGARMLFSQDTSAQDQIAKWIAEGRVKVFIDEEFPFSEDGVNALFEKIHGGKSVGKNILRVVPISF